MSLLRVFLLVAVLLGTVSGVAVTCVGFMVAGAPWWMGLFVSTVMVFVVTRAAWLYVKPPRFQPYIAPPRKTALD